MRGPLTYGVVIPAILVISLGGWSGSGLARGDDLPLKPTRTLSFTTIDTEPASGTRTDSAKVLLPGFPQRASVTSRRRP